MILYIYIYIYIYIYKISNHASPVAPHMSCLSYLDDFGDGK